MNTAWFVGAKPEDDPLPWMYYNIIWPIIDDMRKYEPDDFKYHMGRCLLEQLGYKERDDVKCVMALVLNENER